jgi:sodium-dependent dicarboxylate transporter 2/3/5
MVLATLSASCAFMMPVATPPNAIVFSNCFIQIRQMAQVGVLLNLVGIALVTGLSYIALYFVFGAAIGQFPSWAKI